MSTHAPVDVVLWLAAVSLQQLMLALQRLEPLQATVTSARTDLPVEVVFELAAVSLQQLVFARQRLEPLEATVVSRPQLV